jgi:DNA-binding beta-propeller fold protein YncE
MYMINFPKSNCLKKVKSVMYVHTLSVMLFLCFVPRVLNAQQLGSVITFQETISSDEEGEKFFFPSVVFADPFTNELYLIDGKSRIIIFNSDFFPVHTIGKNKGIETPQGLTVDARGTLYVAQSESDTNPKSRISVYSSCLKWERDIYFEGFEGSQSFIPYRLAADKGGNLYVSGNNFPGVLFLDNRGSLIDIITPEEGDKKVIVTNVMLDKEDRLYIVSEEEGRIYLYDKERNFIMKFGEKGGSSGKLSRPRAVGVDESNGRMYVVDYMRHTITVYNRDGTFIFEFGGLGWGEGWFQHPGDLAVDNEGRIIVADTFNQRVQVFNSR